MKVENADIIINFFDDLVDRMSIEQKRELAKLLTWDAEVLDDMVQKLTTNYASSSMDSVLHNARLNLLAQMPEAAANLIRALVQEVERAKQGHQESYEWAWKLWHQWPKEGPNGEYLRPPDPPPFKTISTPCASDILHKCGFRSVDEQANEES